MIISVTRYEKRYELGLESVAQLCGQNVIRKNYIVESIIRYFGNYKYLEERNPWRDNVFIDGENVGRKQFQVISVRNRADLISVISFTKQSLLASYVKELLQEFDVQKNLEIIDHSLETIIEEFNKNIQIMGEFQLSYEMKNVWEMVQNTELVSDDMSAISEKNNYDMLLFLIGLIEKTNEINPSRKLVVFENIDHLITKEEYKNIMFQMLELAKKSDIKFICSVSLDGYVVINDELITQITVINDVDFTFPNIHKLIEYIELNYPIQIELDKQDFFDMLKQIINDIGRSDSINSLSENVICKLLNKSLMINQSVEMPTNKAFQAFFVS